LFNGCISNPATSLINGDGRKSLEVFDSWDEASSVEVDSATDLGITSWIQPKNLKNPCRLWLNKKSEDEEIDFFWDGDCEDGYAVGLGRVFAKGFMRDDESVFYYEEAGKKPILITTYLRLKDTLITLGFNNNDVYSLSHLVKSSEAGTYIGYSVVNNNSKRLNGVYYKLRVASNQPKAVSFEKFNSTKSFLMYEANAPLLDVAALIESRGREKYKTTLYTDGTYTSKKSSDGKVKLPKAYIEESVKTKNEIAQKISEAVADINSSQKYFNFYVKKACQSPSKINEISDKEYHQICGDNNYFSVYNDEIKEAKIKSEQLESQLISMKLAKQAQIRSSQNTYANEESFRSSNRDGTSLFPNGLNLPAPVQLYQPPKANAPRYYHYNGKSIIGSDGSSCTAIGNSVVCN